MTIHPNCTLLSLGLALCRQKVQTVEDLMSIVEDYQPGQTVRVRITE